MMIFVWVQNLKVGDIMGRTILCNSCKSTFDEDVLKMKNSEDVCLVCGASLSGNDRVSSYNNEQPDFSNPDLYFYEIDDSDEYDDDLRDVWCQCTSCKTVNTILLSKFDSIQKDYVKLKKDLELTCKGCGKKIINRIVPQRPKGWRDLNDWERTIKCPICSSSKIHKISMTNKAASAFAFGIFAAGHVSKTYKCDICGAKF